MAHHHTRHLTRLLTMIALLAFMVRSLVPDGYMPTFLGDGSLAATICIGTTAETGQRDAAPGQSDDKKQSKPCLFFGLISPLTTPETPVLITIQQAPLPLHWHFSAWADAHPCRAKERPWATGPPTVELPV